MPIVALNFPKAALKLTKKQDDILVWCVLRKKNLILTPEEWVRQHTIHWLINDCKVPPGLIFSEKPVKYHTLSQRADLVVYSHDLHPQIIVECKAPEIGLNQNVFEQAARYNSRLQVNHLFFTNGLDHVFGSIDPDSKTISYSENVEEVIKEIFR